MGVLFDWDFLILATWPSSRKALDGFIKEKLGWQTSCSTSEILKDLNPKYLDSCCTVNRMDTGAVLDILSLDIRVGRFTGVVDVEFLDGILSISSNFNSSGVIYPWFSRCFVTCWRISWTCLGDRVGDSSLSWSLKQRVGGDGEYGWRVSSSGILGSDELLSGISNGWYRMLLWKNRWRLLFRLNMGCGYRMAWRVMMCVVTICGHRSNKSAVKNRWGGILYFCSFDDAISWIVHVEKKGRECKKTSQIITKKTTSFESPEASDG